MSAGPADSIRFPDPLPAGVAGRPLFVGREPASYGEVAQGVRALSGWLAGTGAGVGDRVAIWMDKQPRYAQAIFAALRTGCVYVPLDGGQPVARVATILADAEPVVLVVDGRRLAELDAAGLPASVRAIVLADEGGTDRLRSVPVCSWTDAVAAGGSAADRPPAEVGGEDLAALLYTSGSTGVPKGVQIAYRNLAAFIDWTRDELDVGPADVFANHASFNFDLSTFDLFVAASCGAALWIVDDAGARDVAGLAAGIREHGVTVWYSVPSVLHLLTVSGALTAEAAASLRYVLFAGEVFPLPQLRALAGRLPAPVALYNLYGPTETNVCTYHRVRPEDLQRNRPVPIGVPVGDAVVSIVDEDGRELDGPGAVGELVVRGSCVTPGYWRREQESTVAGHCRGEHRTGDLVSLEEGRLVYRGRRDRMVKLSGHRVELGEIEAAVLRHPAIAEAAVVVTGAGPTARLELYYTLRPGAGRPNLVELKRHCVRHLPRYMVPQTATCLAELPHNANGKIDHRRLGPAGRPTLSPVGVAR